MIGGGLMRASNPIAPNLSSMGELGKEEFETAFGLPIWAVSQATSRETNAQHQARPNSRFFRGCREAPDGMDFFARRQWWVLSELEETRTTDALIGFAELGRTGVIDLTGSEVGSVRRWVFSPDLKKTAAVCGVSGVLNGTARACRWTVQIGRRTDVNVDGDVNQQLRRCDLGKTTHSYGGLRCTNGCEHAVPVVALWRCTEFCTYAAPMLRSIPLILLVIRLQSILLAPNIDVQCIAEAPLDSIIFPNDNQMEASSSPSSNPPLKCSLLFHSHPSNDLSSLFSATSRRGRSIQIKHFLCYQSRRFTVTHRRSPIKKSELSTTPSYRSDAIKQAFAPNPQP
ncbi:hypothetical protein ACLOJK_021411 [Asimina triloba]